MTASGTSLVEKRKGKLRGGGMYSVDLSFELEVSFCGLGETVAEGEDGMGLGARAVSIWVSLSWVRRLLTVGLCP